MGNDVYANLKGGMWKGSFAFYFITGPYTFFVNFVFNVIFIHTEIFFSFLDLFALLYSVVLLNSADISFDTTLLAKHFTGCQQTVTIWNF